MSPQWTSHRYHEVIASKSELILLLKPLSDGTATHPEHRHQWRTPLLRHSSLSPQPTPLGSIHLAPNPKSPPWSKPPGHSPAGACHVAFLLIVLCPFNPFSTQQPEGSFKSTNVIMSHPCLKACGGSPSLQNPAPTPRPSQTGPQDPPRSLMCCKVQAEQCFLIATSGPLHTLSPWPGRSFSCFVTWLTPPRMQDSPQTWEGTSSGKSCCPHKVGFRPLSLSPFIRAATAGC